MLRIVHVNQRAHPDSGLAFVVLGSDEHRPGVIGEHIVCPLDVHDVGVLGDRPERLVGRHFDP
jgi:hypothetical protein